MSDSKYKGDRWKVETVEMREGIDRIKRGAKTLKLLLTSFHAVYPIYRYLTVMMTTNLEVKTEWPDSFTNYKYCSQKRRIYWDRKLSERKITSRLCKITLL